MKRNIYKALIRRLITMKQQNDKQNELVQQLIEMNKNNKVSMFNYMEVTLTRALEKARQKNG